MFHPVDYASFIKYFTSCLAGHYEHPASRLLWQYNNVIIKGIRVGSIWQVLGESSVALRNPNFLSHNLIRSVCVLSHSVVTDSVTHWTVAGKKTSSRRSFWPRDWTHVSCISCTGRQILYHWAIWEALKWGCYFCWARLKTADFVFQSRKHNTGESMMWFTKPIFGQKEMSVTNFACIFLVFSLSDLQLPQPTYTHQRTSPSSWAILRKIMRWWCNCWVGMFTGTNLSTLENHLLQSTMGI